jgi:hypothetical protein
MVSPTLAKGLSFFPAVQKILSSGAEEAAPAPTINVPAAPPGLTPAKTPAAKPARKSMQSSFFSGAAMAQQQGGATSGAGKTLIGS